MLPLPDIGLGPDYGPLMCELVLYAKQVSLEKFGSSDATLKYRVNFAEAVAEQIPRILSAHVTPRPRPSDFARAVCEAKHAIRRIGAAMELVVETRVVVAEDEKTLFVGWVADARCAGHARIMLAEYFSRYCRDPPREFLSPVTLMTITTGRCCEPGGECKSVSPLINPDAAVLPFIVGASEHVMETVPALRDAFVARFERYPKKRPYPRELIINDACACCLEPGAAVVTNAIPTCQHVFLCNECDARELAALVVSSETHHINRSCWFCREKWISAM